MARSTVLPLPHVSDVVTSLRSAEIDKVLAGNTIDTLVLQSEAKVSGRLSNAQLDVTDLVTAARIDLTLQGASTLTVDLLDPDWLVESSGLLDLNEDERLDDIDVFVNGLGFRLAKTSRQDPTVLELSFEDIAVAWLRRTTKHRVWSRGSVTRAQAVEAMVNETNQIYASPPIGFFSPEKTEKQRIVDAKLPQVGPSAGGTGFRKGVTFDIKGVAADAVQKRNVAIVMSVCDRLAVTDKVRRAAIVTAIGESSFQNVRNTGGSDYGGVFQGRVVANANGPKWFSLTDTEKEAYYFLKGGKGYQQGGAIDLLKRMPNIPEGEVSWRVGGDLSNFGGNTQAATAFYQQWIGEARHIAGLWKTKGGGKTSADTLFKVKEYTFTRGLPGKRESSWDAAQRLAAEVNWRFYIAGGVAAFVTDEWLIAQTPSLDVIADGDYLLEPPTYDIDHGKVANAVSLRVTAERWSIRPGAVVQFDAPRWGPINGRWIVLEVSQNLFDTTDCTVTLTKPVKPRPEPAPEITTVSKGSPSDRLGRTRVPSARTGGTYSALVSNSLTFAGPDQGIDFTGAGTIYAPADLRITRIAGPGRADTTSWPGGHLIAAEILSNNPPAPTGSCTSPKRSSRSAASTSVTRSRPAPASRRSTARIRAARSGSPRTRTAPPSAAPMMESPVAPPRVTVSRSRAGSRS